MNICTPVTIPSQAVHVDITKVIRLLYVTIDRIERTLLAKIVALEQKVDQLLNKNKTLTIDERP